MAGREVAGLRAMVFHGGEAVFQGTAFPALLAGDKGSHLYAQLVEHDIFPHQSFFREACAHPGVEVVQGIYDGKIRFQFHQGRQDMPGDGGGVELQPHSVGMAGHMGYLLQPEAVVQPQGGDAQHAEGRDLEFLDAEQLHGLGADIRDDLHACVMGGVENGAQVSFQRLGIRLGDMQGSKKPFQAERLSFLKQSQIFFQGIVQSGID